MNYYESKLEELLSKKQIRIHQALVEQFRNFAASLGIYVEGGAILPNDIRVLYID